MSSYYDNLGVKSDASAEELRRAYRGLAMKYHPDQNQGNAEAEQRFREISEAYDVLKDAEKRAVYDQVGHDTYVHGGGQSAGSQDGGFDFSGFSGVFDELFGGRGGGRQRQRQRRGEDLRADVTLSLEEAFEGKTLEIPVNTYETCGGCHGSGAGEGSGRTSCSACQGTGQTRMSQGFFTVQTTCRVCAGAGTTIEKPCQTCRGEGRINAERTYKLDIPGGIESDTRLRLTGKGAAGRRGESKGDLYVFVSIKEHPLFQREGNDLYCIVPLSPHRCALGGDVDIPTIDGTRTRFNLPAGTQHGQRYKLSGKGMTIYNRNSRGNMIVLIDVEVPKKLTREQEKLFRALETSFEQVNAKSRPKEADFAGKMRQFLGGFAKK